MKLHKASIVKKAIAALRAVAKTDADDTLRANIFRSAFDIVEKNENAKIADIFDVVQLCAKPQSPPGSADASFQDIPNVELPSDLPNVRRAVFVGERRIARDHRQPRRF